MVSWIPVIIFAVIIVVMIKYASQNLTWEQDKQSPGLASWELAQVRDQLKLKLDQVQGKLYATATYGDHTLQLISDNRLDGRYTQVILPPGWPSKPASPQPDLAALLKRSQKHDLLTGRLELDERQARLVYEQFDSELTAGHYQQIFALLVDWADTVSGLTLYSGHLVPMMEATAYSNNMLRPAINALLKRVARDTETRLFARLNRLWCPHCRARFTAYKVGLPGDWQSITYYGCRFCRRGEQVLVGRVIVTLDPTMAQPMVSLPGKIRVNWATVRQPFDFDAVEIGPVDDETVERFAMQVGNDTDPLRRPRYKRLPCRISPAGHLSANTIRILQRIFGEVERG